MRKRCKSKILLLIVGIICATVLIGCGRKGTDVDTTKPSQECTEDTTTSEEDVSQSTEIQSESAMPEETESLEESETQSESDNSNMVIYGNQQFIHYVHLLGGKRVAIYSNQTGIVGAISSNNFSGVSDETSLIKFGLDADGNEVTYGQHILDALLERGVNVTTIFCPEHGFRGGANAGEVIDNTVDEKTGIPIVSLHEYTTLRPEQKDIDTFDVLIIDIQDVGLRYYTYYIAMFYLMDACAANGKEVIVLDRPNPNGFYVDGPILQDAFKSGVGMLPIPIVHGMTFGELAQMMNGEGWLSSGKNSCDLTVIPCKNYTHQTKVPLIISPSPNLKDMKSIYLYSSTCFFENTVVSVGRGTEYPFHIYGSPYLQGEEGYEFEFVPVSMAGATYPVFQGTTCYGVDLRDKPLKEIWSEKINLNYLIGAYTTIHASYPEISFWGKQDKYGRYYIDLLCGTDTVRKMIEEGCTAEEIKASWQEDIDGFLVQRRPYLLYAE